MRMVYCTALAAISAVTVANANPSDDAMLCSKIGDSLQRLSCFDHAFPKSETAKTSSADDTASEVPSGWDIRREKSAIDDSPTINAVLLPKDPSGSALGSFALAARCVENKTSVVVFPGNLVVNDLSVTTRIDEKPAKTATWSQSDNYRAVGLWAGAQAIPFLKELSTAKTLTIRVEDTRRYEGTFDLGNVAEVVAEIAAACKWKQ